jgi:HD-GYP domain-containing protein (c-di-GMP phosphodiesterase class II)
MVATIEAMGTAVEVRDPYTAGHQRRVARLATAIGRELALPDEQLRGLQLAGSIHDLGKLSVPSELLVKPSRLTELEMSLVRLHVGAGYEIIKNIDFPWPIARMVREHHERLDGSGYPQGLKGEMILLESRILAVADTIEAMASHRPYRAALGVQLALAEIERGSGTIYDPDIANACLRMFRDKGFKLDRAPSHEGLR